MVTLAIKVEIIPGKSAENENRRSCFLQIPVEEQHLDDAAKKENEEMWLLK